MKESRENIEYLVCSSVRSGVIIEHNYKFNENNEVKPNSYSLILYKGNPNLSHATNYKLDVPITSNIGTEEEPFFIDGFKVSKELNLFEVRKCLNLNNIDQIIIKSFSREEGDVYHLDIKATKENIAHMKEAIDSAIEIFIDEFNNNRNQVDIDTIIF